MARINAGQDFGQATVEPVRGTMPPREAFGNPDALARIGAQTEAQGLQAEQQQIHEQRVARQRADAAQAQARISVLRDSLNDTITQIDSGVQDGTIAKTDAEKEWRARSAKILADGLKGVPESHQQIAQIDANAAAEMLGSKIGGIVKKRDQSDTAAALGTTLEHTSRLAVTDPEKARAITDQTLDQLGPAAGWSPQRIQQERQRWVESTATTRAYTAITAARTDNKALSVVEKSIAENQDLDPQRRATMLAQISQYRGENEARALRQAQHAEIVAQRVQRESSAAFNVLSGWALSGKVADENAAAPLLAKLTPTDAAAYRAMAAEIPARTAAAMQPLKDQQAQLDALYQQRNQQGTSERLEKEIQRREEVLRQSKKDYADEPLRAADERGLLDQPLRPIDTSSVDGFVRGMAERVQQARTASGRAGTAVSPLLNDEAQKLSEMLGALPVGQRATWVKQLATNLPPEMSRAIALQINDKDKALRFAFEDSAQMTTNGRSVGELYLRGAQAMKDGTSLKNEKQPDMKQAQWSAFFSEQVNGMFPNQKTADAARDRAMLVAHAIASENGGKLTEADMQRALRLSLGSGELVPRGQTITKGGRQQQALIPLPAGMSESDLNRSLSNLKPADLAAQAPDGKVRAGGVEMPLDAFLKSVPSSPLLPVRPGIFAPLVNGRPVLNSQGQPITIKVN